MEQRLFEIANDNYGVDTLNADRTISIGARENGSYKKPLLFVLDEIFSAVPKCKTLFGEYCDKLNREHETDSHIAQKESIDSNTAFYTESITLLSFSDENIFTTERDFSKLKAFLNSEHFRIFYNVKTTLLTGVVVEIFYRIELKESEKCIALHFHPFVNHCETYKTIFNDIDKYENNHDIVIYKKALDYKQNLFCSYIDGDGTGILRAFCKNYIDVMKSDDKYETKIFLSNKEKFIEKLDEEEKIIFRNSPFLDNKVRELMENFRKKFVMKNYRISIGEDVICPYYEINYLSICFFKYKP